MDMEKEEKTYSGGEKISTLGEPSRGYALAPYDKRGFDYDAAYAIIYKLHSDELHRFPTHAEAMEAWEEIATLLKLGEGVPAPQPSERYLFGGSW